MYREPTLLTEVETVDLTSEAESRAAVASLVRLIREETEANE